MKILITAIIAIALTGCKQRVEHYGTVECSGEVTITINEDQLAALTALFADNQEVVLEHMEPEDIEDIVGFLPFPVPR